MSSIDTSAEGRAAELRRAFDRSFAEPPARWSAVLDDLLAIGIGAEPFAVRLRDVSGLFADKTITALPSRVAELVGVAAFRGAVVPVYDLRPLLGYPVTEASRWLLVVAATAASSSVALAFDRFEGHLRVAPDMIAAEAPREHSGHVREVVRYAGMARPIVDVPSIIDAIARRAGPPKKTSREER